MTKQAKKIIIIGGGAAGFFAALSCGSTYPDAEITILEKTSKLLSKVKISGGGRCNVTHACFSVGALAKHYPRGEKFLKQAFHHFMPQDTIQWFEQRGVTLKTEEDGRMFPVSDNSQTIIDCFLEEAHRFGIKIKTQQDVKQILKREEGGFLLKINKSEDLLADKLIVASGSGTQLRHFDWLRALGHSIEPPVPSLFTFNMPKETITELMGVVAEPILAKIQSTKLAQSGPLLITHWGVSGPAILKLSAWGARLLQEVNYDFKVQINWLMDKNEEAIRQELLNFKEESSQKKIKNFPQTLPKRLWLFLLDKAQIDAEKEMQAISKAELNRLAATLSNDLYPVKGKTTFKEEFVTCGGLDLSQVNPKTMESKIVSDLFFAGEVLNIDGITGGFNFQAAWTTGYLAGLLGKK